MNTGESTTTTNHELVRKWIEERNGYPAVVINDDTETGILRVDFDGSDEDLRRIDWDRFFDIFEENRLAFLYQDYTSDGGVSRFCKFVDR